MTKFISDIAFTPSVKAQQCKQGSRQGYQAMAEKRDWQSEVTAELETFIAGRDSFYLATSNADGQPYIQHRGGPKGFLKVLDPQKLAFADYSGNRQYISVGNLDDNDKAYIFLMDYDNRQRVKIWGTAKIIADDPELLTTLRPPGASARVERAIVFTVGAWDVNCPQHIPQKVDIAELDAARARIESLEAELATLKG